MYAFIWSLILISAVSFAQQNPTIKELNTANDLSSIIETVTSAENQENVEEDTFLTDLLFYAEHPINLNNSKQEELQMLHLLSDLQLSQLYDHIKKNGKLLAIYELQSIALFDLPTIEKILPYVYVSDNEYEPAITKKGLLKNGQHSLVFRCAQVIEKQRGFRTIDSLALYKSPNTRYAGSPQKIYMNYRYNFGKNIRFGMTAEKDQGELFFKNNLKHPYSWYKNTIESKQRNGFDFYSAHIFISHIKFIEAFAIGDYTLSFGQGLTIWNGMSFAKSTNIFFAKKNAPGIRPYTSTDESRFMRGIASCFQLNALKFTFFYSKKPLDAIINDTLEPQVITSLPQTGMHSTASEIKNKNTVIQTIMGGNIHYTLKKFSSSITLMHDDLNLPFYPLINPNNQFEKGNSKQFKIGLDYQFIIKNLSAFGEASRSKNGGLAFLNGIFISLDPRLSLTVLHRFYGKNYLNEKSSPFSESGASNEKGIYAGINWNINRSLNLNANFDRFEFPWLRYLVDAPSQGNDFEIQLTHTASKKLISAFLFRYQNKQQNTSNQALLKYLVNVQSTHYRFTISYPFSKEIKLKNRLELIHFVKEFSLQNGYLLYQDIGYTPLKKSFSLSVRYALFQTDSYDTRLYAYENDIPGAYSIPALYDRGTRFYLLFNYNLTKHLEVWCRFSGTFYNNKEIISEGSLTEIQGNSKSEVKVQLRLKW